MSKVYPVGAATYSKKPDRYPEGAPHEGVRLDGAWVNDTSKGWLVDLTSGMGAVILGHRHKGVDSSIAGQLKRGVAFPLPHPLEEQLAQLIVDTLTWEKAESVRFGKNGADVTTSAVRLARAVTGRNTVLYFDYHGHHDWCMLNPPMNAGVPWRVGNSFKVDDRDWDDLMCWVADDDIAAIVLEPVPSDGFDRSGMDWQKLRELCDKQGWLLILDEMVSGFRAAPGGMAEVLGIEPDLACYGKGMANGMPLSAIVGPYEYMRRYEEDVFFSLTHGGEALSLIAADVTIRELKDGKVLREIGELGNEILEICGDRAKSGYPQRILFDFDMDELAIMLEHGVLCAGYANLTLAHARDRWAREQIMEAVRAVVSR